MKRLFKPLVILTPLAVFASLQFSGPNGEPINSVLDPLLPAKAHAGCYQASRCWNNQGTWNCNPGYPGWTCWVNEPERTNCWETDSGIGC